MNRRGFIGGALAVAGGAGAAPPSRALRFPVRLEEMAVTDARSGRTVRLVQDVMADRVVLMNFMFLGCSTICPMQSALLARTQGMIGRRMGREVTFVSVTINPVGDSPEKLRAYADAHDAGAGWHFVRGDFQRTDRLRAGFDSYAPVRDDHPPVFCIGRAGAARWSRLYGMPAPREIAREILTWLV